VSFVAEEEEAGNYAPGDLSSPEGPGVSAFYKDSACRLLDLVAKGHDEEGLPCT